MASISFPYRRHGKGLHPIIPVELTHLGNSLNVDGLVDSGSNFSIFHAELGEAIGLPVERGEIISLTTVSDEMPVYLHSVQLSVKGLEKPFSCRVGFARRMKASFNLLGRIGLFDLHDITFREHANSVEVTEI